MTRNIPKRQIHRAGRIIIDASKTVRNGYLETENGFITAVCTGSPKENCIDHGPGVLMPAFVNTHLHLELSALKDSLPFDRGFQTWVETLLEKRHALGSEKLALAAKKAVGALLDSGNLYVGEISTLGMTKPIVEHSGLNGIFFQECLGSDIKDVLIQKNKTLSFSVAGHGPHTTSPQLLKRLKNQASAKGLPFSIHVAESKAESEFIQDKKGDWADFLISRGIDYTAWDIGSKTPVAYLDGMNLLDPLTIAVHLINVTSDDIQRLARSRTKVCVCPRSNWNLHRQIPDISGMINNGLDPALGTDSLASCDSLDISDEMAFIARKYPGLDPRTIFSMATVNGARALGLEHLTGTLSKGKKADFIYRPIDEKNETRLFEKIISNEP